MLVVLRDGRAPATSFCVLAAGDIVYGMAHDVPRRESSTQIVVDGSDLDVVVLLADDAPDGLAALLDEALLARKWLYLRNPAFREEVDYVVKPLARLRQQAATRLAAQSLVQLAQLRELVSVDELKQPQRKQQVLDAFQQRVMRALQAPQARLLALYGFEAGDAQLAEQRLAGDWADDLFNPALLKQVGLRLGKGAAIGAAVGAVADVALAGLSLGTGMALGATVGGIASQGWKPAWALLRNRLNGQQTLRLEDAALCLLALCAAVVAAGTVTAWLSGRAAAGRDAVLAVKEDW